MKEIKIYTKTGDKGTTALWSGKRVSKNHPRLSAYGTIDELNSYLGVVQSTLSNESSTVELSVQIAKIQNTLFLLGSYIACDDKKLLDRLPALETNMVAELEDKIDLMQSSLAPLTNFILPNGHIASAHLQVARCICRRAERVFIDCKDDVHEGHTIEVYINRLSDYLFVAARWINEKYHIKETIWRV